MVENNSPLEIVAALGRIGKGLKYKPLAGKVEGDYAFLAGHIDNLAQDIDSLVASHYKLVLRLEKEKEDIEKNVKSLSDEIVALKDEINSHRELRHDFVASMNHKLRTPLTSIVGFSSLLVNRKDIVDPKDQEKYLEIISKESTRLLGLVDTLLDLTRLSSGEITLTPRFFSINKLIAGQIENWSEKSGQFGVSILFHPDESLEGLVADPRLIMKMIDCLLGNAVKHSSEGKKVTVSSMKENDKAIIIIEDEGEGIPKEKLDLVFQNFTRKDGHLSHEGLGLRLSLVRSIVWLHLGSIDVKSNEGFGARFEISLPLDAISELEVDHAGVEGSERATILVVDDDQSSRNLIVELLKDCADVVEAGDGEQAIMSCERSKPDLILMDLLMPVMDGFTAIKKIRENEITKHTPIIAVSALTDKSEVVHAYHAGADNFISKPFQRKEVIEAIKSQLKDLIVFEQDSQPL